MTINLPASHYMLEIRPTLSPLLNSQGRQFRLFVKKGPEILVNIRPMSDPERERTPVFETRLQVGVNTIVVECVAGPATVGRATEKVVRGEEVELERFTVFANLAKP